MLWQETLISWWCCWRPCAPPSVRLSTLKFTTNLKPKEHNILHGLQAEVPEVNLKRSVTQKGLWYRVEKEGRILIMRQWLEISWNTKVKLKVSHDLYAGWSPSPPAGFYIKVGLLRLSLSYAWLLKETKFLLLRSYSGLWRVHVTR